jgi:hypothetical protein
MDPISLAIFGSVIAAIPAMVVGGVVAPKAIAAQVTPGLEACRQHLRKEEATDKLRRDALRIRAVCETVATDAEDAEVDRILDSTDWTLVIAQTGAPLGPSVALRAEEVFPFPKEQKALITVGEEKILQCLLNKEDKREYALVLRRIMQWTVRRKAVLGL